MAALLKLTRQCGGVKICESKKDKLHLITHDLSMVMLMSFSITFCQG